MGKWAPPPRASNSGRIPSPASGAPGAVTSRRGGKSCSIQIATSSELNYASICISPVLLRLPFARLFCSVGTLFLFCHLLLTSSHTSTTSTTRLLVDGVKIDFTPSVYWIFSHRFHILYPFDIARPVARAATTITRAGALLLEVVSGMNEIAGNARAPWIRKRAKGFNGKVAKGEK